MVKPTSNGVGTIRKCGSGSKCTVGELVLLELKLMLVLELDPTEGVFVSDVIVRARFMSRSRRFIVGIISHYDPI